MTRAAANQVRWKAWSRILIMLWGTMLATGASLSAGATPEPEQIVVSVPGPHNLSYLPIDLIPKIGMDRAEGVNLQLLHTGGGSVALGNLTKRNADFAVAGLPAILSQHVGGGNSVGIAAVDDATLAVFMVRTALKKQVKRFADLRGRVVGVSTSSLSSKSTTQQLFELLLKADGLRPDMVRIVSAGLSWPEQAALIESGMVDGIMSTEPFASRLQAENKVFILANLADPETAGMVPGAGFLHATLATRPDFIDSHPQQVERMVKILRRTLQWIATHSPEELVEKLDISDPAERLALLDCLKKYPHLYSKDGRFSLEQLHKTEIFFHTGNPLNSIAQTLKVESVINDKWAGRRR